MAARLDAPRWVIPAGFTFLAGLTGLLAGVDPKLAIGAGLGLSFVIVATLNLTAGLLAFTFLAFMESALPSGAASLIKAAGLLLALAWLAKVVTDRDGTKNFLSAHAGVTYLMLAFLAWGALSITWSEDPSGTIVNLTRYLLNFSLVVITFSALTRRRDVSNMYNVWLAGITVTAAYGFLHPAAGAEEAGRLESTVGDANELAAVLVVGIVLSLSVAITARHSPALRVTALAVATFALFSFVFTGSRGGIVALGAALVAGLVMAGPGRRAGAMVALLGLAVTAFVFFSAFAPQTVRDRVSQTTPGETQTKEGRTTVWAVGWRMVEANPVRGVGLGSFQTSSIHYVLAPGTLDRTDQVVDTPKVAHNIYLQALAELGIVGLLMFLGLLGFPLVCAVKAARNFARRGDYQMEIMSRALVVALAAYLTADFFLSNEFSKLLWILLAMGPVVLAVSIQPDRRAGVT
jgi:O-antigen ligase